MDYTAELVDRRQESGIIPGKADVFNYLLQNKGDDKPLSRQELLDNSVTLVVAGSETTATLLTATTYFLARNRDVYRRATSEVRSRFNNDGEITLATVNDLPYMIAVLAEGLRVFSPTPFGFPRIIDTPGGQSIAGYHVPEKVRSGSMQWTRRVPY